MRYKNLSDRSAERESQVNELNLLVSNMGSKITQMKENYDQQLDSERAAALRKRGDSSLDGEAVWAKIDEMAKQLEKQQEELASKEQLELQTFTLSQQLEQLTERVTILAKPKHSGPDSVTTNDRQDGELKEFALKMVTFEKLIEAVQKEQGNIANYKNQIQDLQKKTQDIVNKDELAKISSMIKQNTEEQRMQRTELDQVNMQLNELASIKRTV